MLQQFGHDAAVRCFLGVSMEMSLLGVRGTAHRQPRQGLAQGHPEGHGQGQGCCLPSRGLSGLAPVGDTGLGEAWGGGNPPRHRVSREQWGAPSLLWPLRSPRVQHGWARVSRTERDGMGQDGMGCPFLPCQAGGQGQPHARGPPQSLPPSLPCTPL